MPLNSNDLAQKLHDALGISTDGNGKPLEISSQTKNYAQGVIAALKAAIVSNLPGTITGVTAAGSPLVGGAGSGGIMVVQPAPMTAILGVGLPPVAVVNLQKEATALASYLSTGLVIFTAGTVTGQCTSTPTTPGPLVGGTASNGKINGLTGPACMASVMSALGSVGGPNMLKHYSALVDYILANAAVNYSVVTGLCPMAAGPLGAGAAAGGIIT